MKILFALIFFSHSSYAHSVSQFDQIHELSRLFLEKKISFQKLSGELYKYDFFTAPEGNEADSRTQSYFTELSSKIPQENWLSATEEERRAWCKVVPTLAKCLFNRETPEITNSSKTGPEQFLGAGKISEAVTESKNSSWLPNHRALAVVGGLVLTGILAGQLSGKRIVIKR